jgi:hypothetical protein
MRARLEYSCEAFLERLLEDLQDMPLKLRQFIHRERAVVGERHLPWQWHLAPSG